MNKGLEALRKTRLDVSRGNCEYNVSDYLDTIEKELKALEIIKEKRVNMAYVLDSKNYKRYIQICNYHIVYVNLTQEEFELIKEVLENDNHSRV